MNLVIKPNGQSHWNNITFRCALGRGGISNNKKEGDGITPAGKFALRQVFFRSDRISAPRTILPITCIKKTDAWCDCPESKQYNKLITLPISGGYETLWRTDAIYDLIAVVGYNDQPVIPGNGSAIFVHLATPSFSNTKGCVAFSKSALSKILEEWTEKSMVELMVCDN